MNVPHQLLECQDSAVHQCETSSRRISTVHHESPMNLKKKTKTDGGMKFALQPPSMNPRYHIKAKSRRTAICAKNNRFRIPRNRHHRTLRWWGWQSTAPPSAGIWKNVPVSLRLDMLLLLSVGVHGGVKCRLLLFRHFRRFGLNVGNGVVSASSATAGQSHDWKAERDSDHQCKLLHV